MSVSLASIHPVEPVSPSHRIVVLGFVALTTLTLYVPTFIDISRVYWRAEQGSPGLLVLIMWFWLLWRERHKLAETRQTQTFPVFAWLFVAFGVALYALGRSQQIHQLEIGSALLLLPGMTRILAGPSAARRLWFVWLFLALNVPLPGSMIDAVLVPMKDLVSAVVTSLLFTAGIPIARDGVVIYIGHYQMFIADACSGLNQLVALVAIGLLYARVTAPKPLIRDVALIAGIVPIAMAANLLRVSTLVLATYFGGDALGRSLHDVVGYLEILVAFGSFFALDSAMKYFVRRKANS